MELSYSLQGGTAASADNWHMAAGKPRFRQS
jgi:hypothetical protein